MSPDNPRRIVVTGATRGLGRALVDAFGAAGHTVVGCGRDATAIAELRELWPTPHQFHVVDVTRDDDVSAWASEVLAAHAPPDLLINNAGVINRNAPLWELEADEIDLVVDVNVKGVVNVLRHFLPSMAGRQRGIVANMSSGWGRSVSPEVAIYCATKWAIEGLTQALAEELPPGMAAVAVNPGVINTDMLRTCWAESAEHYPDPAQWVLRAAPFLLRLSAADNGQSVSV
ncbi:MAG: SDR family NAD(P)-dependent oxidoreductase [Planctomycetota bacterium]|nr:MAG: SDR family NAD(P)-dependent oxidoreductase [Planctomycetota bacterium]